MKILKTVMMIMLGTVLVMPMLVSAEEFKGRINGMKCTHFKTFCPLTNLEEHLASEPDFILMMEDGSSHILHNLPRDTKVRYVGKTVVVTGIKSENTDSIYVNEFSNEEGKKVWSWEQQTKSWEHEHE